MEDKTGHAAAGTGYPLDELRRGAAALTIGSDDTSDVVLTDDSVAPRHAWLIRHGDGFLIEDADSEHGTFVNEKQYARARRLRLRDTVRIGNCALVYALSDTVCPHCHHAESLVAATDPRRAGARDKVEQPAPDDAVLSTVSPLGPTHECHQCGRQFWIVSSRWAGWWRRWQWRSRIVRQQVAGWLRRDRQPPA